MARWACPASIAAIILPFGAMKMQAAGIICASVSGNLVANCGFETGDFTDWTVGGAISGGFDGNYYGVLGNLNNPPERGIPLGPVNSGSWAAYFGTDVTQTIAPITLSQTLTAPAGVLYTITFYLDQNALTSQNTFSVTFAGATLTSVTDMAPTNGYVLEKFTYDDVSVVNPVLEFSFENQPDYFFLDDVAVAGPATVPEPSGLPLAGAAIGLLLLAAPRGSVSAPLHSAKPREKM
jgi:hypothetical protein